MAYIDTSYRLIGAVCEGNLERANELITSFGLSYSQAWSEGYVLLCDAIENRHTEIIKLLLTNGSKVNSDTDKSYNTPLHFAVINGDIKIVKMLLDRCANVNATTKYGTTSLHYAIQYEKMEIVELLLNHGANVNASDILGVTPLCLAVHKGHVDGVKMLMDRGATINAETQNVCGTTLLHDATENEEMETSELLLNNRANINVSDITGFTQLQFYVQNYKLNAIEEMKIAELLSTCGANVNASNTNGVTPLCLAVKKGHIDDVKMLLDRGTNVPSKHSYINVI